MYTPFLSRVGGVISADIAVPKHDSVKHFYARILSTGISPLWRDDLTNNLNIPIIGIGATSPEYKDLPLQWMPHMQVEDVATSVAQAVALGGRELMHGKDDDGNSQWAVLLDPNNAAFGVIPVVPTEAMPSVDKPEDSAKMGQIGWLDITVRNADTIRDFYQKVVGWSVQPVAMEESGSHYNDYNMVAGDDNPGAGICHARGVNLGLPEVWMIYLPVADLKESLRRAEEEGGKIIKVQKEGDVYRYAAIADPVGACFALMQAQ